MLKISSLIRFFKTSNKIYSCAIAHVNKNVNKQTYSDDPCFGKTGKKSVQTDSVIRVQRVKTYRASVRIEGGICKQMVKVDQIGREHYQPRVP